MPTLIIDDKEVTVPNGLTVMQAAAAVGIHIPHFCYHPKLPVSGNCRMCLVEVEKIPKPVIACAQPINDGMVVKTKSDAVLAARRGVMEFLLINHPLDCPVCDQGGECDLQDLSMKYGPDRSRFHDEKRHFDDRDIGPLIETNKDRCIQCTRCMRFSADIAGVEEVGALGRGDHMEVGAVVETLSSELAGNLAETCPVGALNLKTFHFNSRSWELKQVPGVCGLCPVGCQNRRDHQENEIRRVMTTRCDDINETWICDRGRFAYDGYTQARLTEPKVRNPSGLAPASWAQALDRAAELLKGVKPEEVAGLADGRQGAEELFAFQDFLRNAVGSGHIDHRLRQRDFSVDQSPLTRADLLMNTPLAKLESADAIVLVGADPRYEAPMLNLRVRKAAQAGGAVFSVNPRALNANIPGLTDAVVAPGGEVEFLNAVLADIKNATVSATPAGEVANALHKAERPAIVFGGYAINHPQGETIRRLIVAILEACGGLTAEWNGYNRVHPVANAAAAQDMGVTPHRGPGYQRLDAMGKNAEQILQAAAAGEIKVLFLLGADLLLDAADTVLAQQAVEKADVIFLGAYDGPTAQQAEVVLPGLDIDERSVTLTNCEGRAQISPLAVMGPVNAKEDWRILRALSDRFQGPLPYNAIEALRAAMAKVDHRYDRGELLDDELAAPCDHSPVTTGLEAANGVAPAGGGIKLVMEASFYHDGPAARRSKVLGQLDAGSVIRMSPEEAKKQGIESGQRVRVINGERAVEAEVRLDEAVPAGVVIGCYGYEEGTLQALCETGGGVPVVSLAAL